MHPHLDLVLRFATPAGVIGGFLTLIYSVNNVRRQINVQILMQYTQRYEHILGEFPKDALLVRFDSQTLPPQSAELTLCLLKYLNLCSEEYYLWQHKYLARTVWAVWEGDLKKMIASPLLQREWQSLEKEYESHPDFLTYVKGIQSGHGASQTRHIRIEICRLPSVKELIPKNATTSQTVRTDKRRVDCHCQSNAS
jgi:hypothetical protein